MDIKITTGECCAHYDAMNFPASTKGWKWSGVSSGLVVLHPNYEGSLRDERAEACLRRRFQD